MALLFLARHAQASFGAADYDILSGLGERQARWLGEYFLERGLEFDRVITGTLRRQRDTARHVLSAMQSSPTTAIVEDAGLNEYLAAEIVRAHLGDLDPAELQRQDYREYWRMFRIAMTAWTDGSLIGAPESWQAFGERVNAAMAAAIADAGRDDKILVVSSGGAICRAIADLLQAPATTAIELNLQFRNTGFCELLVSRNGMRIISTNSIPHLDRSDRREFITAA